MTSHRRNTLVVDFSVLPSRPVMAQVEEFIKDIIKIDMADVKNIQIHNLKSCVYIEMNDPGVAPRLQKQHYLRHWFVHEGVNYHIPVYVDGPTTTLRIHDLSPQLSNTVIIDHMQQYGRVLSIHNEVWKKFFPGVPNGVRVVKMKLEKQVPSHIVVENQTTLVTYPKTSATQTNKQQQQRSPLSSGNELNKNNDNNQCGIVDPPPGQCDKTDTSESESDDDKAVSNSKGAEVGENFSKRTDECGHQNETAMDLECGKRRLSTETTSGTGEENEPKRSCGLSSDINDAEWKVHNTRSRKKNVKSLNI
uniref:Putative translation elongation factor ef-1 alpha/tu n=1 Tax=Aedes aegypti TaxID=7159 RepID=A0A0P6IUW4_AEDAE